MEKVEIPTMKPTSSVWIPHPRPLRRSVGDGGGCVEGGRFSDLGQLFACARDIAIGKDAKEVQGDSLGNGQDVSWEPGLLRSASRRHPSGGSISAIVGPCIEGNRRARGSLTNSVDDNFE